jgi:hypothetical protein
LRAGGASESGEKTRVLGSLLAVSPLEEPAGEPESLEPHPAASSSGMVAKTVTRTARRGRRRNGLMNELLCRRAGGPDRRGEEGIARTAAVHLRALVDLRALVNR